MIHITNNNNNNILTSPNHQKFGKHILAAAKDQERNSNVRKYENFSHTHTVKLITNTRFLIKEAHFQLTRSNFVNQDHSQLKKPI